MKLWQNLRERLPDTGPDIYHDPGFMEVIEQHLSIIKKEKSNQMALDPDKVDQFRGDFFGLLKHLGVGPQYWFTTLRLSGMVSPTDFNMENLTITVPDFNYLEQLRQQYQTIRRT